MEGRLALICLVTAMLHGCILTQELPDAVDAEADGLDSTDAPEQDLQPSPEDLPLNLPLPDVVQPPACISANPSAVNFGGKRWGEQVLIPVELSSCGDGTLEIYGVYLTEGSSPDFGFDLGLVATAPSLDDPVRLPPGESLSFMVAFIPDDQNPTNEEGELILDKGVLVIESNAPGYPLTVALSGAGVCNCGHTAIIKCEEGIEVVPQTVLHLFGDESYTSHDSEIAKWEWSVDQPAGSQSVFIPSASFPNPTFEVNVAGVYTFYLTIRDAMGTPSVFPAEYVVVVIPCEAIHVELLWHTPQDLDETDTGPGAGSDLDLHFLHPFAAESDEPCAVGPEGWFSVYWSCFWLNKHPNWGSFDPSVNDDPGLDRDDTDGAGPENLNLDVPENLTYRIGVHYFHDHGFGSAFATVRVYICAQLVFEAADVLLSPGDLWEVATIKWPSGKVSLATEEAGQYKITSYLTLPSCFQWK